MLMISTKLRNLLNNLKFNSACCNDNSINNYQESKFERKLTEDIIQNDEIILIKKMRAIKFENTEYLMEYLKDELRAEILNEQRHKRHMRK